MIFTGFGKGVNLFYSLKSLQFGMEQLFQLG